MTKFLKRFRQDESGAITVDWVVLTAAIVGFGVLVVSTISAGATDQSTSLGARLEAANVPQITFN